MKIELPDMDKMPNVDKSVVLKYVHSIGFFETIIHYAIHWTSTRKVVQLQKWITENLVIPSDLAKKVEYIKKLATPERQMKEILKFTHNNLKYIGDTSNWGVGEYWQTPTETWTEKTLNGKTLRYGDCFAGYEEIYTNKGIKKIENIKEGDVVLSYDFEKKDYIYKPVIKHWLKGKLQINRVHLRNGQWFDVSKNHPMWHRTSQKKSNYEKQNLSEIDLTRWWKRKIPIATKIPYIKSIPIFSKDIYKVIGHYIAEGWMDKGNHPKARVCSSGYDMIEHIYPILKRNNIPFKEGKNGNGVPIITFGECELKQYLKGLKRNSFDITLYEELITLPKEYLKELIYGMWIGDGTKLQYADKRGYKNNKEWTYCTSSKQLADDLQRMFLQLGKSLHIWKQENHQGVGNKPIYRLNYNSKSKFMNDFGYKDISEVSIKNIEKLEDTEMYDLTVADTHTVILKNGVITHQCEDGAILMYGIAKYVGISDYHLKITAGKVQGGGHCYLVFMDTHGMEYPVDWTYWYNSSYSWNTYYVFRDEYFNGTREWFRINAQGMYKIRKIERMI